MFALRGSIAVLLVAGGLAACSSVPLNDDKVPVESRTPSSADANGANGNGSAQSQVATVDLGKSAADAAGQQRVIYFDFDSFVVKEESRPVVEAQAKRLSADHGKHVALEGHTDERGGREYNLALGQKRAEAVAKSLVVLGASNDQIEAVSFGKERPAVEGSDEEAWAKNRRVEVKDR